MFDNHQIDEFNYRIQKRYVLYMLSIAVFSLSQLVLLFTAIDHQTYGGVLWLTLCICINYLLLQTHGRILYGEVLNQTQKILFIFDGILTIMMVLLV